MHVCGLALPKDVLNEDVLAEAKGKSRRQLEAIVAREKVACASSFEALFREAFTELT